MTTSSDAAWRQYDELRASEGPFDTSGPLACSPHITLLPLRYGVVAADDAQALSSLPSLPSNLAQGLPALTTARYAVRPLRMGYLYGVIKRNGQWELEIEAQVDDNGRLKRLIETDTPCEPSLGQRIEASLTQSFPQVRLHTPDAIEEARLLFTPDPLTRRMRDKVVGATARGARLRQAWQRFNLRKLAYECGNDADVLLPDVLAATVADWAARGDGKSKALLRFSLSSQLFARSAQADSAVPDVYIDSLRRAKGVALVLHDPVGITQELNAWRNGAIENVRTEWLVQRAANVPDGEVDNERALLVAQGFAQVEQLFQERTAAALGQHEIDIERARVDDTGLAAGRGLILSDEQEARFQEAKERHLAEHAQRVRARYQARLESGEFQRKFESRYATLVDRDAMRDQERAFNNEMEAAQKEAERRARDHRLWRDGEALLNALDVYDNEQLANGIAFAEQTGRCVLGMEACKADATLIGQWWKGDPLARDNLAMRGYGLNQKDMLENLKGVLDEAKQPQAASGPGAPIKTGMERAKDLSTAFDKANSLYETLHAQGAAPSVGAYAWFVGLGRQVFRTAAPNALDKAAHQGLRRAFLASVGSKAVEVRMADLAAQGKTANPRRVRGQVTQFLDKAWAEGVASAHSSDFYKVRVTGALCLLEASLMLFKAGELPDSKAREKTELAAAALTTAAAGFELGVNYLEQAVTRYGAKSVSGRGAVVMLGRMKLWGAGLAGMGGFVMVGWDVSDGLTSVGVAVKKADPTKGALAVAYGARAAATLTLSVAELCTAIAIAKPHFDYLAQSASTSFWKSFGGVGGKVAGRLGTPAMRAFLGAIAARAFWVGTAVTGLIWIFDDNALVKWCQRCSYRKNRDGTPYKLEEELPALYAALNEVA